MSIAIISPVQAAQVTPVTDVETVKATTVEVSKPRTILVPQPGFSFPSLIIGFLIGLIVMLALFWFFYFARVLIFATCPLQTPFCTQKDYVNDPGQALTQGAVLDDILFVQDNELFYKRVQANSACVPQDNQTIPIQYPEYCEFSNGGMSEVWRQETPNGSVYSNGRGRTVTTSGNCMPIAGQPFTTGVPVVKWDPAPLTCMDVE